MDDDASSTESPPRTALIVDDIEGLRRMYRSILEARSHVAVVGEAGDGRSAIEQAGEHQPDLILLDLSMPGMDGLEALPSIKEASPSSDVVVLSGFLEKRFAETARERGATAYLEKEGNPETLLPRLEEALGQPGGLAKDAQASHANGTLPEAEEAPAGDEKAAFAYAASHDLQEPLRMIASYVALLDERLGDQSIEDHEELFSHIRGGVSRMQRMIDGLLTYSHVETREGPMEVADLGRVVDDALSNLDLVIEETGSRVEPGELPDVVGDPNQLIQLFQNLIENAVKHSQGPAEEVPRVEVCARDEGSMWEIRVEDHGQGIPPEDIGSIFSLFQRGSTGSEEGAGIGLAICKRIVERHGGEIGVESAPGEGATFRFTLPKPESEGLDG